MKRRYENGSEDDRITGKGGTALFTQSSFQFLTHVVWRIGVLAELAASYSTLTSRLARLLYAIIQLLWSRWLGIHTNRGSLPCYS